MTAERKLDEPINEESCEVCAVLSICTELLMTPPYGYPMITLNHQKPDSLLRVGVDGYDIAEHLEEAMQPAPKHT